MANFQLCWGRLHHCVHSCSTQLSLSQRVLSLHAVDEFAALASESKCLVHKAISCGVCMLLTCTLGCAITFSALLQCHSA